MEQASNAKGGAVDATRVLNLFGYVGPVASLMTHTLLQQQHHHHQHGQQHGQQQHGGHHAHQPRHPLQRVPSLGPLRRLSSSGGSGNFGALAAPRSGGANGGGARARFVTSRTEDAIDSVLPCAAERVFKRPSRFANAAAMRFSLQP